MANRRLLVKRRKSIRNIRKITRTMQLIATARFQAAYNRAVASRPYTEKLAELVADLSRAGALDHPLLTTHNPDAPPALVVVNSHRGLCGGYNSAVLRVAQGFLDQQKVIGKPAELYAFGKKGIAFFKFSRQPMAEQNVSVADSPRFEQVEPTGKQLIAQFLAGKVSSVHVAYMRFYSAGKQRPEIIQLLPLANNTASAGATTKAVEYEFSPDPESLLNQLLPATVRARLFQAFIDAAVSEQVARMAAMKAATDASEDMIKNLTRKYNRARQTAITTELLDIVGGANALA
jgi:F-type H+-transporting ATPase subunit gamma